MTWTPRPGLMIPPSDTRPVLWAVTAWREQRPRLTVYDTTWTAEEALMRAFTQARMDASLPPDEWREYLWTVLRAEEVHALHEEIHP